MNKTMEYMAFELPVVAFDLRETRVRPARPAVYVTPNDVHEYAKAIVELMDDEDRRAAARASWGGAGWSSELAWSHQERAYLGVYRAARLAITASRTSEPGAECAASQGVTSRPTAGSSSTS